MTKFIANGILLVALSSMAHADISDSGALSIGQQGVIAGTMTVQGNAFSVGGSTFQVAGGSITLGGRLNTAAGGIKWADGTVQVSSPPVIPSAILVASRTFVSVIGSTTATTFTGACFSGSSVSITVPSLGCGATTPKVKVFFHGATTNTADSDVILNFLQDGAWPSPFSATIGFSGQWGYSGTSGDAIWNNSEWFLSPAAGQHTYCLQMRVSANTGSFANSGTTNQWGAELSCP